MRVSRLSVIDFRNYESAEIDFRAGLNLIIGMNGQGKTNLVEAIAYFSALSSHRTSQSTALIRAGRPSSIVRMGIRAGEREAVLELQLNRSGGSRARVSGNDVQLRDLPKWFQSVLFAPEDLSIVRGDPAGRRSFIDSAVVSLNPATRSLMQDYERVVRQRNALLKSLRMGADREKWDAVLQPWDDQLIELGVRIMLARRSVVSALALPIRSSYRALVESDHRPSIRILESALLTEGDVSRETFDSDEGGSMGLIAPEEPRDRKPSEDSEVSNSTVSRETLSEAFRAQLSSVRSKEVERGASLIGPHRDDLLLELNGLPVKGYASHGETWSFVLSMKLALAEAIRLDASNGDPVLLLDDVFAELDEGRRERLISAVGGYEQIIVTTAVEGDVPASLVGHRVDVHEGRAIERDQSLR